ncbi:putative oxalocrotonate tautomerase enzyme-domain-containing protein [Hyaloraphidium curvatum]|nr:putative oxalocrotonate tautomerase enzyme-domain-containing protein [Hyaloraphidium curvatum]
MWFPGPGGRTRDRPLLESPVRSSATQTHCNPRISLDRPASRHAASPLGIYAPATLFSPEEKRAIAKSLTAMYTSVGLPAFYVIVLFIPVEADSFFIGNESHDERASRTGKPFVRIVSQHLARANRSEKDRQRSITALESRFKPFIADKGYEWELHIEEPTADLWRESGISPPAPRTPAEKLWVEKNEPSPYEGETMAEFFAREYKERL